MLTVKYGIPEGLLDLGARELHRALPGPTLIHVAGRRTQPLLVSTLLHGDEHTGWEAARALLRGYGRRPLPRAVSLFIGNVAAAREGLRRLPDQPDFNRIWATAPGAWNDSAWHAMARELVIRMRRRRPFAAVDIHNNTGLNPHYACVRTTDPPHLHLATLFGRTVVYFQRPEGVQTQAFAPHCPSVTLECGRSGEAHGVEHAIDFLHACLRLTTLPGHPVAPGDIDLFHTVAVVKVPPDVSIGIGEADADLVLAEDLDRLNFSELPVGTTLGHIGPRFAANPGDAVDVRDEQDADSFERFFSVVDGELRTAAPLLLSMLSVDVGAIRQDCLCYVMERLPGGTRGGG